MSDRMTKAERDDLVRLVKQRERVAKTAAEQRSAAMLAEFEQQISALHDFNTNDVWKAATDAAVEAAKKANEEIVAEADRLGIPKEFQPKLTFSWARRGENEYRNRRDELRRVAKAEIDALEKIARVQIEAQSVQAQTEIIANGLSSDDQPELRGEPSAGQLPLLQRDDGAGERPFLRPPGPSDLDGWRLVAEQSPRLLPAISRHDLFAIEIRAALAAAHGDPQARPAQAWGDQAPAAWLDQAGPYGLRAPVVQAIAQWTLRGVADGVAPRIDQLRLLGNGVSDPCGALALRTLATELSARSAGAARLVQMMEAALITQQEAEANG